MTVVFRGMLGSTPVQSVTELIRNRTIKSAEAEQVGLIKTTKLSSSIGTALHHHQIIGNFRLSNHHPPTYSLQCSCYDRNAVLTSGFATEHAALSM